jgi:hypothetical protein
MPPDHLQASLTKRPGSLSDRHNFGHSVTTDSDHWLLKPRPVIWEYLFLDGESPLRLVLGDILDTSWLPDLHVDP